MLFCSAALRADVTVVQTTTVEGGMAAMAPAGRPEHVAEDDVRVKGMKTRTEIEVGPITVVTIVDLADKQIIILRRDQKTATIVARRARHAGRTPDTAGHGADLDASIKPTGKSQVDRRHQVRRVRVHDRDGHGRDGGAQVPPEAAAMMQGMKMNMVGSIWVAKDVPGAAEYIAFQKAARHQRHGRRHGERGRHQHPRHGQDDEGDGRHRRPGLPDRDDHDVEGTGQIADMMKQMGAMKITDEDQLGQPDPDQRRSVQGARGYTDRQAVA